DRDFHPAVCTPPQAHERGRPRPQPGANNCTVLRTRLVILLGCGRDDRGPGWRAGVLTRSTARMTVQFCERIR
ncbi:MAG TPA: hypothetical protein PKM43_21170, partial [Verrucomicrobiota bacterium]|nr:hypothetical protein [Verrucomicrobiota bacterium]